MLFLHFLLSEQLKPIVGVPVIRNVSNFLCKAVMDVRTMADRERKDNMTIPSGPPYYEGDSFCFEEFVLSARAFLKQTELTKELALQKIRDQTKISYVRNQLR